MKCTYKHLNHLSKGATWKEQEKNSRIWTTIARGVGKITCHVLFTVEMKHRVRRKNKKRGAQDSRTCGAGWCLKINGTQSSGYCLVMMIPRVTVHFQRVSRVLSCHICMMISEAFPCNNRILFPSKFHTRENATMTKIKNKKLNHLWDCIHANRSILKKGMKVNVIKR